MESNTTSNQRRFRQFLLKESKWQLILIGLPLIGATIYFIIRMLSNRDFRSQYDSWVDPAISLGTLLVAMSVWYNEKRQDWISGLPKRLTINYKIDGKDYIKILNASLSGEDDIRPYGQSVLRNFLSDPNANFNIVGFKMEGKQVDFTNRKVIYTLTQHLKSNIQGVEYGTIFSFDDDGRLIERETTSSTENKAQP